MKPEIRLLLDDAGIANQNPGLGELNCSTFGTSVWDGGAQYSTNSPQRKSGFASLLSVVHHTDC